MGNTVQQPYLNRPVAFRRRTRIDPARLVFRMILLAAIGGASLGPLALAALPARAATLAEVEATPSFISPVTPSLTPAQSTTPPSTAPGATTTTTTTTTTTIATTPAEFSPTGRVVVSGTRQSGSSIVVTVKATGQRACTVAADQSVSWSCTIERLPNGPAIVLEAQETPRSETDPTPPPVTTSIDVLGPPALDGDGDYLSSGLVSGIGFPGSTVSVSYGINGTVTADPKCANVPVGASTLWSCNISAPTGGPYTVRAQQSNVAIADGSVSAYSNAQRVTIDREAPASAIIRSPKPQSRVEASSTTVSGTGENAGVVDVYVDNVISCSATVSGGVWSCVISGYSFEPHLLQAIQRDAAGNFAAPSKSVLVFFGALPVTPSPSPSPSRSTPVRPTTPATPAPSESAPTVPAPSAAPAPPPPLPSPSPSRPEGSFTTGPLFPRSDGQTLPLDEALTNWGSPTGFGDRLGAVGANITQGSWYTAPGMALLFIILIALPLRLLATTMRGRIPLRRARFTGRNPRARTVDPLWSAPPSTVVATPVNPWLAGALPLGAAAGFIALAVGINGEVRYVRLVAAIVIALVLLNVVGGALSTRLGSRLLVTGSRLRFLPIMLAAAAVTAVLSRLGGIDPPLIAGVIIGPLFAAVTPVGKRALVNLIEIGAITVLGVLAWIAHGLFGVPAGFWASLTSETLAAVCLAGLGSALLLTLPIASLPGRVLLEWSLPVWLVTTLVVGLLAALVVCGTAKETLAFLPWMVVAAVFAAVSVAVWTFVRFVEPALRP